MLMPKSVFVTVLAGALAVLQPTSSHACVALKAGGTTGFAVAKNYDWIPRHGHGSVFVNKRNVAKSAQLLRGTNPVEWVSKYGSVSFSQFGAEFPLGGMNEQGLVIEILVLPKTEYGPESDSRPAINEAQWIQYHLDTASTLAEVIQSAERIRIEKAFIPTHYFICDAGGECGLFEYLDGKLEIISGTRLEVPVATNDRWATTMEFLKKVRLGEESDDGSAVMRERSGRRFARAARQLMQTDWKTADVVGTALDIIKDLELNVALQTFWSIAHRPETRTIYFRTRSAQLLKAIDLRTLDFSCRTPVLTFDMNRNDVQFVNEALEPLTREANRALIDKNWLYLKQDLRDIAARYPTTTVCLEP
ncbi:MAG: linear amide C-N hydrolase [Bdellovibrionaceae bacterium]|nr:linear amide C-N hydrolase [Pseudobdellovibrionaceae bacterium]